MPRFLRVNTVRDQHNVCVLARIGESKWRRNQSIGLQLADTLFLATTFGRPSHAWKLNIDSQLTRYYRLDYR